MEKLLQAIYKVAQKKPDTGAFQDMLLRLRHLPRYFTEYRWVRSLKRPMLTLC